MNDAAESVHPNARVNVNPTLPFREDIHPERHCTQPHPSDGVALLGEGHALSPQKGPIVNTAPA